MEARSTRRALAALTLVPFLLQLPAITGWLPADPLLWMSGLATRAPHSLFLPGRPGWLDGNAGITLETLGRLAARDWLGGTAPWWNPDAGIGMPLAAEMQNGALFLPFVLLLALPHGLFLLKAALQVVAGLASFALLRQIGLARPVCFAFALLFELDGTFAWFAHGPMLPVPFLPLLLLGIERCAPGRGTSLSPLIVGGAIAFSITAGFPETAFLDGLTGLAYAVARAAACATWRERAVLARRVAAGGTLGLLFAAPAIVAFADYLPVADLGQNADIGWHRLRPENYALLLFPYLFGTLQFGEAVMGSAEEFWWHVGGYLWPGVVLAALCAARRRQAFRRVLGIWVLLTMAAAAGVPGIAFAFGLLPLMRHTMLDAWIVPSWEMLVLILAACTVDDWMRDGTALRLRGPVLLLAAASLAAIVAARHELRALAGLPRYPAIAIATTAVTLAAVAAVAGGLRGAATRVRVAVVLGALEAWAVLAFAFPLASSATDRPVATGVAGFLRAHLDGQRAFAFDVLAPNYASFFGVASANYSGVPDPLLWTGFIRTALAAPYATAAEGYRLPPGSWGEIAAEVAPHVSTADTLGVLAELGVRYLVSPRGDDPFVDTVGTGLHLFPAHVVGLDARGITASITSPALADHAVERIDAMVGTYAGLSDGTLTATICSGGRCAAGAVAARGLADNRFAHVGLAAPLPVGPDGHVEVRLAYGGGTAPLAAYEWPLDRDRSTDAPAIGVRFRLVPPSPVIWSDARVEVRALPEAAPYMADPTGHCAVAIRTRTQARVTCRGAGMLVRRELFFPGWHATVGGRHAPIRAWHRIFQAIPLPAGASTVRFAYRPPGTWAAGAACGLALAITALMAVRARARRRPHRGAGASLPAAGGWAPR